MKTPRPHLAKLSQQARRHIIEMSYRSKTAEIGSALCIADILTVLYFSVLDIDPKHPEKIQRDRFILSKGHGAAALYAVLALRGFFSIKRLDGYRVDNGTFHGHPCRDSNPGIEISSGSLGHGLSIAAGMALTMRKNCPNKRVFVLLGDGECNEGSIWEAAMFIATHKLTNVIAIVDMNGFQGFGKTSEIHSMDIAGKFAAFGWTVYESNGHDHAALEKIFTRAKGLPGPAVILAHTVAGKGIPHIENTLLAHYYIPDEKTYREAMQ